MVPEDSDPAAHTTGNQRRKREKGANNQIKKPARKKKVSGSCVPRPEDLSGEVKCNFPEWQKFLLLYPMINSLQREDFPDHGVSFVYVAHIYCTKNTAEESSRSQKEFEDFFKKIGYEYDYSGNFESRWFEGIGVKIN
jgi:hypothetical protein